MFATRLDCPPNQAASAKKALVECVMTDGGISNNFPVSFFDALIPDRPTFGVNLVTVTDGLSTRAYGKQDARDANRPRLASGLGTSTVPNELLTPTACPRGSRSTPVAPGPRSPPRPRSS